MDIIPSKKADKAFFVYIGPSIRGIIQCGMVIGGTREQVENQLSFAIEKYPRVKTLLVSGETLAVDRFKLKTPGNMLYEEYRRFATELNKQGGMKNA